MTSNVPSLSLRQWSITIITGLCCVFISSQYWLGYRYADNLQHQLISKTETLLADTMTTSLVFPLATQNHTLIQNIVDELVMMDDVHAIDVYDATQTLIYRGEDSRQAPDIPLIQRNIVIKDNNLPIYLTDIDYYQPSTEVVTLGTVSLWLTTQSLAADHQQSLLIRSSLFLGIIGLCALLLFVFVRKTKRYITTLLEKMQKVQDGEFTTKHPRWIINELNDVADGLDTMSYNLGQSVNDLTSAKQRAEEANELKTQFIDILSYELRKPINAVTDVFEHVMGKLDHSAIHPLLISQMNICASASRELRDIVDELINFKTIEHSPIKLVQFRPSTLFDELYEQYMEAFQQANMELVTEPSATQAMTIIEADQRKISRIVSNLLHNALKYSTKGRTVLHWDIDDDHVFHIRVTDSGMGIAANKTDRIFTDFYQIQPEQERINHRGLGLGLSVVDRLLFLINGTIEVDSTPGVGSTFSIQIPITVVPPLRIADALSALVIGSNSGELPALLAHHGIASIRQCNSREAPSIVKQAKFDLIFLANIGNDNIEKAVHDVRSVQTSHRSVIIHISEDDYGHEAVDATITQPLKPTEIAALLKNVIESNIAVQGALNTVFDLKY